MSKELNKAPVEQAGGDERATFELFVRKHCGMPAHIAVNWDAKFTNDAWAGWQARAALAQPSPMRCLACGGYHGNSGLPCPNMRVTAQAQPSPTPHPASELDFSRPLETENGDPVKWICADVIEYKSARVCVAKDTGLVYSSPYIGLKIRNVMPEQAEAERPEGPTEDELEAAGLGYPLHKEEAVKLWYSGFRSEVITVLEAWEAIGHDIGMNPDKGELLDSLRYMLEKCEAHDAALARVAELERQQPVAWMHDQPNRVDVIHRDVKDLLQRVPGSSRGIHRPLDVSEHYTIPLYAAPVAQSQQLHDLDKQCRDDVARALGLRPSQERGFAWSYLLASIKSCVKASEDAAQAQHSVPGNAAALVRAEAKKYSLNAAGMLDSGAPEHAQTFAIVQLLSEFDDEEAESHWEAIMAYSDFRTSDALFRAAELLAAAPGTEVPQAWLDVQAERRRQVEAEGWTPEHDDEHNGGELADAAACYALWAGGINPGNWREFWPWAPEWLKHSEPRRMLVKAAALILAEIQRLDRAAAAGKEVGHE